MIVLVSTYQSIEVVAEVQKQMQFTLDLIVCDEAHRTTGVTLKEDVGKDESAFVRVHDETFLHADRRLYMTATSRLYAESSKEKAKENEAVLCLMDEEWLYDEEIHRLGFGQAVTVGLLTDYKVLVMTISERDITPAVQKWIASPDGLI